MSKYSEKKERQAKEREAAERDEQEAAKKPAKKPEKKPAAQTPQPLDAHDAELLATAIRRTADAVVALAEVHRITKALKAKSKRYNQGVFHLAFQVSGAAWTRSCGVLAKLNTLTSNLNNPIGRCAGSAESPKSTGTNGGPADQ